MSLVIADRVRESSSTMGTGQFALDGALTNYQSFVSAVGSGNTCYYAIVNTNADSEWEVGLGTVGQSGLITILTRNVVYSSSNNNAAVNFSTGTKTVSLVYPASQLSGLIRLSDIGGVGLMAAVSAPGNGFTLAQRSIAAGTGVSVSQASGSTGNPTVGLTAELTGLAGLSINGFVTRTNSGSYTGRQITVTGPLSITNGDGVAGNPSIFLVSSGFLSDPGANGIVVRTSAGQTVPVSLVAKSGVSIANADGTAGSPIIGLNAELSAVGAISVNGFTVRTGAGTRASRTITGSTYVSVTNGDGVAGNPSIIVETSALDGRYVQDPGGSGIVVRTGLGTAVKVSLVAQSGVSIANADGTAGSPIIGLNAELSALGAISANGFVRRVAAGTYLEYDPIPVSAGGTGVSTAANGNLLIGNGSGFTIAPITAGAGIAITNGAGSITVATSGVGTLTGNNTWSGSNTFQVTAALSGIQATGAVFSNLVSLTDAVSIALNFSSAINFIVQLGGSRTLEQPTNCQPGQSGCIYFIQDGTGSRTLAYNSAWKFSGGTTPTLTTTSGAVDILNYTVRTSAFIVGSLLSNVK